MLAAGMAAAATMSLGAGRRRLRVAVVLGAPVLALGLLAALHKGRPGYAAVDVYEPEPVADHPLLRMLNVLCTPHLGWAEWTNFELYFRETFEQIVAYEQGGPMRLANPEVQPRV